MTPEFAVVQEKKCVTAAKRKAKAAKKKLQKAEQKEEKWPSTRGQKCKASTDNGAAGDEGTATASISKQAKQLKVDIAATASEPSAAAASSSKQSKQPTVDATTSEPADEAPTQATFYVYVESLPMVTRNKKAVAPVVVM